MKIAILDDYQNVALEMADWNGLDVTVYNTPLTNIAMQLVSFDVICVMRERTAFSVDVFKLLPNLKMLVTSGKVNAAIDLAAAKSHDVIVCGTNSPGHATAELTWGLILSLTRLIPTEFQNIRDGGWQTRLGTDVRGKTLGIIGLGRMGAQVANVGKAFGMNVIAWSRNLTQEKASLHGVNAVDKETLFSQSDIVSIHMKYSDEIQSLVDQYELNLMKKTAYIVNTSRAPIINTSALIECLKAKKIAGAGLDVYDVEPLPLDHPLRNTPRCVLTPHIGYVTKETYEVFYGETVDIIRTYQEGKILNPLTL